MNHEPSDLTPKELSPQPQENDLTSVHGDLVEAGKVEGDVIVTGDISGSYIAIGRGAQVIVQQMLSAAEEAEQQHQLETRLLAQSMAGYVERLQGQVTQAAAGADSEPYRSLLPYRLGDAPFFFGRDQAKQDLRRLMSGDSRGRLTVLHAESGAGKTSLLQAGLAAELLAHGHLPLYIRAWRRSPTLAIKQTLLPDLHRTPELAQLELRPFLSRVTGILGLSTVVYILLDQFEEFFARVEETEREAFIEDLAQCVEDETLRVRFVLSMRKDQFANLSDFRERLPYIFANEYPLKLFNRTEAANAIIAPAGLVGLSYGPGVVESILAELQANRQQVIMPAQLQLVCWALYRGLGDQARTITVETLQQMGGVAGILRNYLRNVLTREISPSQREQAQQVLEALVRSDRTRDILTPTQLSRDVSPAALPKVLNALVSSRLLRVVESGDEAAEPAYELAHDYLVDQIELDPEVLARKAAQELLDQEVAAWQRNPKLRIGEEKLQVIQAQESKIYFSPEAKELYELSKKARRRRRGLLFGLFGSVLLALCVAMLLYQSWAIAEDNLAIAEDALVTATGVIRSAQNEAAIAEERQATAVGAANLAQTAEAEAIVAQATAAIAQQTAEAGRQTAAQAEQTAIAARAVAQTRQVEAQQNEANALVGQATAQAAEDLALVAQQTAQAGEATAQAEQNAAIQAQQTAQALQSTAEASAATAQAVAASAEQARAAAESARREAEQAQAEAEEAAEEAEAEKEAAEEAAEEAEAAAQAAEATRVAVEQLRDQAERELQETQRLAAIIRDTRDCPVGKNPRAIASDGQYMWVINNTDETVTKLQATDCATVDTDPVGNGPADVTFGGGFIWVANRLDNTIQKINPADGATLDTFTAGPGGSEPTSLLYDGGALWVTLDSLDGSIHKVRKIDPASGADLGTFDVGEAPIDLVGDGSSIWVANYNSNNVYRLDAASGANLGVIPVGFGPIWLTYDGSHIWVANRGDDSLTKLSAADGALLVTLPVDSFPDALAFDGHNIWSASMDNNTISRHQPVDGTLLSTLPTAKTPTAMLFDGAYLWVVAEDDDLVQKIPITINLTGQAPQALAADSLYIWVANEADNTISQMLAGSGERVTSFGVGQRPVDLLSINGHVWVVNRNGNSLSKVRTADGVNVGTFSVGQEPTALAYDGSQLWVTNNGEDTVTRLRESDGAVTGTFPVGARPQDVIYAGGHIWVSNEDGRSVSKLTPDGTVVATYDLGIKPNGELAADGSFLWIAYTVSDLPQAPETRVRQLRLSDGSQVNPDIETGVTGSPAVARPAIVHDGTYIWVTSSRTISDSIVTRILAAAPTDPNNLINYPVCGGPSSLLVTDSVWVACKDDNMIQKLPQPVGSATTLTTGLTEDGPEAKEPPITFEPTVRLYLPLIVR